MIKVRRARVNDAHFIQGIQKKFSKKNDILVKSLNYIYENIREFFIIENNKKKIGLIGLHIYWEDLAEIRSFVIDENYRGKGYGEKLLKSVLDDAKNEGIKKVFVLTKQVDFFKKYGFKEVSKNKLPQKIWKDCRNCPKYPDCDQVSLIINLKKAGKNEGAEKRNICWI